MSHYKKFLIITNTPETAAVNQHTLAGLHLTSTQKGEVGGTVQNWYTGCWF